MVKPSGPRRSAPEVELCIPVIDEESTKGRRISMMITMHLLMDAPKSTLGPIGRLGDDLHDAHQAMASDMLGYIRHHWEGGYCIKEQVAQAVKTNQNSPERTGGVDDNTPGAGEVAGQVVSLDAGSHIPETGTDPEYDTMRMQAEGTTRGQFASPGKPAASGADDTRDRPERRNPARSARNGNKATGAAGGSP